MMRIAASPRINSCNDSRAPDLRPRSPEALPSPQDAIEQRPRQEARGPGAARPGWDRLTSRVGDREPLISLIARVPNVGEHPLSTARPCGLGSGRVANPGPRCQFWNFTVGGDIESRVCDAIITRMTVSRHA